MILAETSDFASYFFVFLLAAFLGLEVIKRVSPLLHTPLMSLTNAISAISVVAAIEICGLDKGQTSVLAAVLGTIAVAAAFANIVGGFMITDRMLRMFKPRGAEKASAKVQK
ncbi:MAG TPA: NAD(P) transhydrogenase subunit alpha [Tepidisphaeraceae bacterium]|nr:NAD(P) transhydrogenase subunit alpha [Tepidisphaeraceae bacterium]